jgi:hypothetical protein
LIEISVQRIKMNVQMTKKGCRLLEICIEGRSGRMQAIKTGGTGILIFLYRLRA